MAKDDEAFIVHSVCRLVTRVVGDKGRVIAPATEDVNFFTSDPSRFATSEQIQLFEQLAHEAHRKTASGPTPEEIVKLPM